MEAYAPWPTSPYKGVREPCEGKPHARLCVQQELVLPGQEPEPRSLDSRVKGNRDPEAYRQCHLRDGSEPSGRSESERIGGPESEKPRRPSLQPEGEGSMGSRKLAETAVHSGGVVAVAW